jgi:hypothetical protein
MGFCKNESGKPVILSVETDCAYALLAFNKYSIPDTSRFTKKECDSVSI